MSRGAGFTAGASGVASVRLALRNCVKRHAPVYDVASHVKANVNEC